MRCSGRASTRDGLELRGGHGLAEEEPLDDLAAQIRQRLELSLGLDTLGEDLLNSEPVNKLSL